jgi:outer membrane protein OmpA-like peptidoglycan-associated protein
MRRRCIGVLGSFAAALLAVGCVPYETYNQTRMDLDKAKELNADLTKKYNQAMQKLLAMEKMGPADHSACNAKYAELERQMSTRPVTPDFTAKDIADVPGAQDEGGGLRLGEALLFPEGLASLKPDAFRPLDEIVNMLKSKYPDEKVIIEGHTDNQPLVKTRETWKQNMNLGYNRAWAVFRYFLDHGIPESRMVVHSYSFNKPLDPGTVNSDDGRKQNRRVVIRRGGMKL